MPSTNLNVPTPGTDAPGGSSRPFEKEVEGLRGIAAAFVGASHLLAVSVLDQTWSPSPLLRYFECGHGAVLIFFMISGYVIGLTNQGPISSAGISSYLRRRGLRLLPIYLATFLFTLAVSQNFDVLRCFGSLFFLQNNDPYFGFHLLPMQCNPPLWSLNYEAVYYFTFLLLWWKQPPLSVNTIVALTIGVIGWRVPGFPLFITGYAVGWIFWSLGCWISGQARAAATGATDVPLLSALFLLLATHHFASGMIFLNGIHFFNVAGISMVNLSNLALLPACTLCLLGAAHRTIPGQSLLTFTAFAIPVATAVLLIATGRLHENDRWIAAAIFTAVACALLKYKRQRWLAWCAPFGSISYAFYLIHFPLLYLVQRFALPSGTNAAYALRVLIWTALCVALSWLLERRLQPLVRRLFKPVATVQA